MSYVNLTAFMLKIKYLHNIWTTLNGKIDYGCSSRKERFENSNVRCNYSYKLFEHWDCKFISIIILWKICTNTIKRENFWWNRWSKNTSRYSRYFINPYDLQNHWYPIIWIFFCHVTPEFRARISMKICDEELELIELAPAVHETTYYLKRVILITKLVMN